MLFLRLRQAAANEGLRIIDCSPCRRPASPRWPTWLPYRPGEAVERGAAPLGRAGECGRRRRSSSCSAARSLAEPAAQIAAAAGVLAQALAEGAFPPGAPAGQRARRHRPRLRSRAPARARRRSRRAGTGSRASWGSVPARARARHGRHARGGRRRRAERARAPRGGPAVRLPRPRPRHPRARARRVPRGGRHDAQRAPRCSPTSCCRRPATPSAAGTTTNLEGRVSRLAAKVVPPGVARADWVIATELADRLGADLGFESLEGIWAEIERVAPAYSGCTAAALAAPAAADGIVVPLTAASVQLSASPAPAGPDRHAGDRVGRGAGRAARRRSRRVAWGRAWRAGEAAAAAPGRPPHGARRPGCWPSTRVPGAVPEPRSPRRRGLVAPRGQARRCTTMARSCNRAPSLAPLARPRSFGSAPTRSAGSASRPVTRCA